MNIRIPKVLNPNPQYIENDLTTIGEYNEQLTY